MKFFITSFVILMTVFNSSLAQQPVLYGVTSEGNGGIFRYDSKDEVIKNVYRFKNSGLFGDATTMIRGNNGVIYGVANGGPFGYGVIYSLDPITLQYKILKNFRGVDGAEPFSIVQGKDGKLYGSTRLGDRGGNIPGQFFSFDPVSSAFKILLRTSLGELTSASNGILYGLGSQSVYSYNPETGVFSVESPIPGDFGGFPVGSMIETLNGNLYGVIRDGGVTSDGVLFSYSINSKEIKKVFDFNYFETGSNPFGKLTVGSDGNLYLVTSRGGAHEYGTIVRFDPTSRSVKVIHNFDGINGGQGATGLTEGQDGKLYGMTNKGVDFNSENSIFYSVNKDGTDYKILRHFNSSLGYTGTAIFVNDKIYGVAPGTRTAAGVYSSSSIFSYQSSTNLFQRVTRNNPREFSPGSHLLQASDGRFYGLTRRGGPFGNGGIFSFNPATRLNTRLLAFNDQRGKEPIFDGLIQAFNGKIYGMTMLGGTNYSGVIFSYEPQKSKYVVLRSFTEGVKVETGFAIGNDGKLYGTFSNRMSTFQIVLFSVDPATDEYKEVRFIDSAPGGIEIPGKFMPASDGLLYACSDREILSFNAKDNILKKFPCPEELSDLSSRLVEASDHKLYGIHREGFIFSFNPSDGSFSERYVVPNDTAGYHYFSDLVYASDGLLYGTANMGYEEDASHPAILYSFDPKTKTFKLLRKFNEFTGGLPYGQLIELNTTVPPIVSITDKKMFEGEIAELTVSLNRISMEPVALNYQTVAGTATDALTNPDFTAAAGQVIIPAGEVSTKLSFPLLEDELIENREWFKVVLKKTNEAPVQLGDSVAYINIKNGSAPIIPPGGEIITISSIGQTNIETNLIEQLLIRANPNPSSNFFTLHINGTSTNQLSITVTNFSGQIMDRFDGSLTNNQLAFGHQYPSGMYFVRILDGKKSKVIKLAKTSK